MKPNQGLENRHSASIMPDLLTLFSCMVSPNLVMSVCWRGTKFQSLLPCLKPYRHCRGQSSIVTSKGCLSSYSRQPATITIVILLWAASHRIDPPPPPVLEVRAFLTVGYRPGFLSSNSSWCRTSCWDLFVFRDEHKPTASNYTSSLGDSPELLDNWH